MDKSTLISKLQEARALIDECLRSVPDNQNAAVVLSTGEQRSSSPNVDFSTPIRPFMKALPNSAVGKNLRYCWPG